MKVIESLTYTGRIPYSWIFNYREGPVLAIGNTVYIIYILFVYFLYHLCIFSISSLYIFYIVYIYFLYCLYIFSISFLYIFYIVFVYILYRLYIIYVIKIIPLLWRICQNLMRVHPCTLIAVRCTLTTERCTVTTLRCTTKLWISQETIENRNDLSLKS